MSESLLHEDLIMLDYAAESGVDLLGELAEILKKEGYVKESYAQAVIEREKNFPTGLNTPGVKVVMPHTDPNHVNKPAILVAKLNHPINFKEMGNSGNDVAAELVFMLAVTDPKGHVETLGKLMSIFSNGEMLLDVFHSKTKQDLIAKLEKILA